MGATSPELDRADREPALLTEARVSHLREKIVATKAHIQQLHEIGRQMQQAPDQQISLTDPDARSMATRGRGTGMVGYNVQTAVDTKHHLIVAHEVTNVGHDRSQLSSMAKQARAALATESLTAIADRGYFKGEEILDCERSGIRTLVPKPQTSGNQAMVACLTRRTFAILPRTTNTGVQRANGPSGVSPGWRMARRCITTGPAPARAVR